jgi:hypothetical protein
VKARLGTGKPLTFFYSVYLLPLLSPLDPLSLEKLLDLEKQAEQFKIPSQLYFKIVVIAFLYITH